MALSWKAARRLFDRDELLRSVGLEQRSQVGDFFTGLGVFSIGVLVGAGLGLMFAPKRGEDMRAMMTEALRARASRIKQELQTPLGAEAGMPPAAAGH